MLEVKLPFRVLGSVVCDAGSHIVVPFEDYHAIPEEQVAWSALQPIEELPEEWRSEDGGLPVVFLGSEPAPFDLDAPPPRVHVCLSGMHIHMACCLAPIEEAEGCAALVADEDLAPVDVGGPIKGGQRVLPCAAVMPAEGAEVFTEEHRARFEEQADETPEGGGADQIGDLESGAFDIRVTR